MPSTLASWDGIPFFSCLMPTTRARRWCIPLAIECFRRQTYGNAELIIMTAGDAEKGITDLLPAGDPRINYVHLPKPVSSLGEKWNTMVRWARYDWLTLWSDDDWSHPDRLRMTVDCVHPGVEMIGARSMLIHELGYARRTFLYEYPERLRPPYLIGGTLTFARSLWERNPFPPLDVGEDGTFALDCLSHKRGRARYMELPRHDIYVAMMHGKNTGNTTVPIGDKWWSPWQGSLPMLMGRALVDFEAAFATRS